MIEDKVLAYGQGQKFRALDDRIVTPGDGVILFQGMQDHTAESIKSLEGFDVAYVEEAQTMSKLSLEMLRPTIRKDAANGFPASEIWFSWNPRNASDPVDAFLRGETPPNNATVVRANYADNPFFPDVLEEERAYDEIHNRDRYAHIWLGEYEPRVIGALWDRLILHNNRRAELPTLGRILVAVDPPISNEEGSDEAGILVVAVGEDGRGYVIDDCSCHGSPQKWATRAVAAYDRYDADAIVAEVNQGGDMVEHVIRSIRREVKVIKVWATKGKHIRAEPISSLYELGKISHVGTFPDLEDQMCMMTAGGYEGENSPDRVCAMVWGFTELFPKMTKKSRDNKPGPTRANSHYQPHRWHG